MRSLKTIAVLILLVGIIFIGLTSHPRSTPARDQGQLGPRWVKVAAVERAPGLESLVFSGAVRAQDRALLSFLVGGRIIDPLVEVGDRVKKGALLARLDAKPFALAVAAAEAQRLEVETQSTQLARDLARAQRLAARGAAGQEEVEKLRAALNRAEAGKDRAAAQLDEARRQLSETRLVAPFAANVLAVHRQTNEMTSRGAPVVELSAADGFEIELTVPEGIRARLAQNTRATVAWPLAQLPVVEGRVTSLGQGGRGPAGLFPVIVTLAKVDGVAPGFTADVTLEIPSNTPLTVPLAAVANPGGGHPFVFVVEEGRAVQRAVDVGRLIGERVGIEGDLQPGNEVVVSGHASLISGEAVEVRR